MTVDEGHVHGWHAPDHKMHSVEQDLLKKKSERQKNVSFSNPTLIKARPLFLSHQAVFKSSPTLIKSRPTLIKSSPTQVKPRPTLIKTSPSLPYPDYPALVSLSTRSKTLKPRNAQKSFPQSTRSERQSSSLSLVSSPLSSPVSARTIVSSVPVLRVSTADERRGDYLRSGGYTRSGDYISSGDYLRSGDYTRRGNYPRSEDYFRGGDYLRDGDYLTVVDMSGQETIKKQEAVELRETMELQELCRQIQRQIDMREEDIDKETLEQDGDDRTGGGEDGCRGQGGGAGQGRKPGRVITVVALLLVLLAAVIITAIFLMAPVMEHILGKIPHRVYIVRLSRMSIFTLTQPLN